VGRVVSLRLVPVSWETARLFCTSWHRHHPKAPPGHIFRVGVANDDDVLVGVAIVGRPVARGFQDGMTLEVNRTVTDGYKNANSMLYGAVARAGFAMGYRRIITYTEEGESGASLRAAGYKVIAKRPPRNGWNSPSRPREPGRDHIPRTLWEASHPQDTLGGVVTEQNPQAHDSEVDGTLNFGAPPGPCRHRFIEGRFAWCITCLGWCYVNHRCEGCRAASSHVKVPEGEVRNATHRTDEQEKEVFEIGGSLLSYRWARGAGATHAECMEVLKSGGYLKVYQELRDSGISHNEIMASLYGEKDQ